MSFQKFLRNGVARWILFSFIVFCWAVPVQLLAQEDLFLEDFEDEDFSDETLGQEEMAPGKTPVSEPPTETAAKKDAEPKDLIDSKEVFEINLLRGELATVKVYSLTRLSITDPGIADVVSAEADKLLVIGRSIGQTAFFLWDEHGKRTLLVRVHEESLGLIKSRVEKLLKGARIDKVRFEDNIFEGKLMIAGELTKEKFAEFSKLIAPFSDRIINLVKEEFSEDLVQIDMQVAELTTTLQKSLGIDWTTGEGADPFLKLIYTETIPKADSQFDRFVKVGDFVRTTPLTITINNLLKEGKGRVLSKPKLVVVSGKEARFQVGGQVPIRTTTTVAGGTATENVTFKDYGIIMTITPIIRKGKIDITMTVEISDIDSSVVTANSVAFTTRSAQTQLLLDDRQTVVLAGLIKSNRSESVKKVPFLGDIPIIGLAFRSRSNPAANTDTEIVITMTPTIIKQQEEESEKKLSEEKSKEEDLETAKAPVEESAAPSEQKGGLQGPGAGPGAVKTLSQKDEKLESARLPADDSIGQAKSDFSTDSAEMGTAKQRDISSKEKEPQAAPQRSQSALLAEKTKTSAQSPRAPASSDEFLSEEDTKFKIENALNVSESVAAYVRSVQKKISEAISYPYEAIEEGWQGTVQLTLKILKDGTLDDVTLKKSSGYYVLDKDAVNTAQILSPYNAFPPELNMKEIIVTIPIVYGSQDNSVSLDVACAPLPERAGRLPEAKPFVSTGKTYEEIVQERIAQALIYPQGVEPFGWEGTVKLNLRILRDGTLSYAGVKESSGNKVLDHCALQTAKLVAPFSLFPAESTLQELDVTVPIVYTLKK